MVGAACRQDTLTSTARWLPGLCTPERHGPGCARSAAGRCRPVRREVDCHREGGPRHSLCQRRPGPYDSTIKALLLDLGLLHAGMSFNASVTVRSSVHRLLDGLNTVSSIILFYGTRYNYQPDSVKADKACASPISLSLTGAGAAGDRRYRSRRAVTSGDNIAKPVKEALLRSRSICS